MLIIDVAAKILFQSLILTLRLLIRLRMKRRAIVETNSKMIAEVESKDEREETASIEYQKDWHFKSSEDLFYQRVSEIFRRSVLSRRYVASVFRISVHDY